MVLWSKFCYVAAPRHSAFTVWMNTHSHRGNVSASVLWRYDGRITRTESAAAHQFCSTAASVRAGGVLLARPPARRGRPPHCAWLINQQRYYTCYLEVTCWCTCKSLMIPTSRKFLCSDQINEIEFLSHPRLVRVCPCMCMCMCMSVSPNWGSV